MHTNNLTPLALAALLAGCGPQFLPRYDAAGTYPFDGYWSGNHAGCSDAFIDALESELVIDGSFPEYDTAKQNDGTITLLGATVDVAIEPADRSNSAHIWPADSEAWQVFEDGTEWSFKYIDFQNKQACGDCRDELVVWLYTDIRKCSPNVLYAVED